MNRRLYFLFPDQQHAQRVVDELHNSGFDIQGIETLDRKNNTTLISSLQSYDPEARIEQAAWNSNLVVFFVALVILIMAAVNGYFTLALTMAIIMATTFLLGTKAAQLPNVHLDEFKGALSHGEVLVMVDVPRSQVQYVEDQVHRRHPEAVVGGVCWHVGSPVAP